MSRLTRSRLYERVHYNTPIKLWRYVVDPDAPIVYGDDNVPTTNTPPTMVWTGNVYLSPMIFSRQRREWPAPEDYDGALQDLAFYVIVGPYAMMPQDNDYVEQVDSDGDTVRFFSQVSPPKDAGSQGLYWHLDLSQPLMETPA